MSYWKYIPHPIIVRFQHYSRSGFNEYDQTQYGITLRHAMPEEIKYQRQQEKPGTRVVFPVTYFDYDRYDFKSADLNTKTNVYSLRSFLTGETYDYSVSYEHIDQTGTTEYTQDTLIFQPNYRFYNEATRRLLDITNVFRYQKIDERKDLELRSLQRWYKPIGPDTLQITGNLGYLKISPSDISASYIATVNANYTKVFSPRLTMIPFIQLNYGELNDRTISGGQVGNQVTGEISRYLRGTGNVFVGMNQNGAEYGIDGYVSTKTRVAATVGYAYSTLFPDDGKTVTNRFYINASGPIVSTLGFNTNGQYVIQDVSRSERPFNQTALLYSANLFWQFYQTALSLGKVRNTFLPQAVIILRTSRDSTTVFDVDGFVRDFEGFIENSPAKQRGFEEKILNLKSLVLGDIARVTVLYQAHIPGTERPPQKGVDVFLLNRRLGRWWIASIVNEIPTQSRPIPEELRERSE